jgi:DNA-directed RNA polymerase subunit N (RpoN/RPB10)
MAAFVRCPSCGFCMGVFEEFYTLAKEVIIKDSIHESHRDPEKLMLNPGGIPTMEIIFDAVEIELRCCRMRLFTINNYDELIK